MYRIDPSHPELAPEIFSYDIDKYIRENLMKRFEWERMTENRLSLLNQKLNGHKLKVITWDMENGLEVHAAPNAFCVLLYEV